MTNIEREFRAIFNGREWVAIKFRDIAISFHYRDIRVIAKWTSTLEPITDRTITYIVMQLEPSYASLKQLLDSGAESVNNDLLMDYECIVMLLFAALCVLQKNSTHSLIRTRDDFCDNNELDADSLYDITLAAHYSTFLN